jgi:Nucleotidyl transferase of unknown function (DUF2204)
MMIPTFEKLWVLLAEAGVHFIVVGGIAVSMQGYVRLTEALDLLSDDSASNVKRMLDRLANYGEGFARELSLEDFNEEEGAIRIVEEVEQCQIDFFTRMSGRRYCDVIEDADRFEVGGYQISVASKASLIGWKSKSVREKGQFDGQALRRLQENPRAFD